jgi:VCBS repeat-containing protein
VTDDSGNYTITGLVDGIYTVTPELDGYVFTPENREVTINGANESGVDFTSAGLYTLTVTGGSGSGEYAAGATVSVSADIPSGKEFDSWTGDTDGLDDVNAADTTFTMPDSDASLTAVFRDAAGTYSISGTVTGDVQAGVTVSVDAAHSAVTDDSGNYTITGLINGTYTVTPELDGYTFSPSSSEVKLSDADEAGIDFVAAEVENYTLTVNNGTGGGTYAAGTVVVISADIPADKEFDTWSGDTDNIADVTHSLTTITMPAADTEVTAVFKDITPGTYRISGTVSGDVSEGVTVMVDEGHSDVTDGQGNYSITGLADGAHTVVPALKGYTFTPDSRTVVIAGANENGVDFTAVAENNPPVAVDDSYTVSAGITLNVAAPGVLADDTDIDGDELTAELEDDAAHGTLTLNSDGSFVYVPDSGYIGSDSFTYRVSDGKDRSAPAEVTITVSPQKVSLGIYVRVSPGDVAGLPGTSFAKTPKIYGTVSVGGKDKKVSLKKDKSSSETLAVGLWTKKVPLYDKKAVKDGYNTYISAGLQKEQLVQLMVSGKTESDKFKDLPAVQVLLVPPEITASELKGNTLTVSGYFFGNKAPKVALEPAAGGKLVKLKVDKKNYSFNADTAFGTVTASYKEGKVEAGKYYIILNNKVGIGVSYDSEGKQYLRDVTVETPPASGE